MVGSPSRGMITLVNREIYGPTISIYVITIHQRYRQTDDIRLTPRLNPSRWRL